jgi:phosphate:Na+ symporter
MSISTLHIILFMIGGLGLFMFGIKSMEDALKHVSGECFKKILKFVVRNRFSSFLVGLVTTTFTQSSTATTVMVVGLINAGFITLFESMGFILGANVGTTATGQLMSFKLDAYAMPRCIDICI